MAKYADLTGQRFNNFTVLKRSDIPEYYGKSISWVCICDCGKTKIMTSGGLHSRKAKTCQCNVNPIYHHESDTRLYRIHIDMIRRCTNPKNKAYKYYGQRGIKVCKKWLGNAGYVNFRNWALSHGYSDELTIDRKNNNGNYSPQNCRWATSKEQRNNQRTNRRITIDGETHTLAEWSEITGVKAITIGTRLRYGWDEKDAVTKPARKMSAKSNTEKYIHFNKNKYELKVKGKYIGTYRTIEDAIAKRNSLLEVAT